MLQWVLGRVEMTDTETRCLTEMEVGTGGGPAVIDFLHLLSPHLTRADSDSPRIPCQIPSPFHQSPPYLTTLVQWTLDTVNCPVFEKSFRRLTVMVHIYIYTSLFTLHVNIDLPQINLRRGRLLLPFKDLNNNILLANLTSWTM